MIIQTLRPICEPSHAMREKNEFEDGNGMIWMNQQEIHSNGCALLKSFDQVAKYLLVASQFAFLSQLEIEIDGVGLRVAVTDFAVDCFSIETKIFMCNEIRWQLNAATECWNGTNYLMKNVRASELR